MILELTNAEAKTVYTALHHLQRQIKADREANPFNFGLKSSTEHMAIDLSARLASTFGYAESTAKA